MPDQRDPIRATRILLSEVCALMSAHADDAVLIGGWVPDVRFPNARPAHVGSIDVDFALRLERDAHAAVVALLLRNGFRPGAHSYQFVKDVALANGRTIPARLDLLTSVRHHAETFGGAPHAPHPIRGAETAFQDNSMEVIGADGTVQIRVAGIASFIVMKSIALVERAKPKDAYDIHFCLENYPDGLVLLAEQFAPLLEQEEVRDALRELARQFHDEEATGPRMVADVEEVMGEARAIRKLTVASRVREFLDYLSVDP
jgi:predicted nucleotidyltransferase